MLLRFRCENFRSIREEQELSLVSVNTRSDERNASLIPTPIKNVSAVRSAAIYGANASGKSNVLRALQLLSTIISQSQRNWSPADPIPAWDPFLLDDSSITGETTFQIDFVIERTVYNYGFRFNSLSFLDEWLIDATGRDKVLFRRSTTDKSVSVAFPGRNLATTGEESQHLELIRLQTRPNSLFLSSAAQSNQKVLSNIFRWMHRQFRTLSRRDSTAPRYYTAEACSEPRFKERIKSLMRFADVGIADFEVAEEEAGEETKKFIAAFVSALKERKKLGQIHRIGLSPHTEGTSSP